MRIRWHAILLAVAGLATGRLGAEELPHYSVHWMCAEAEAIVVAERVGATEVRVIEWLRPPPPEAPESADRIEIVGLDDHHRRVLQKDTGPRGGAGDVQPLTTQRLLCFLQRKGVAWFSLGATGDGSSGLVWIQDGECYRYRPGWNTGGYQLAVDPAFRSEAAMMGEIRKGLADRRDWEVAQELPQPEERAVVLASYLLERTAPDRDHGTYRSRVRQVLPKLGPIAVRELTEVLRTARRGDKLGPVVLILNDMGPQARTAVPLLVPLLHEASLVHPVRVLEALGRIGDSTVAPDVLPFLTHPELEVRAQAAGALAAFRYQDAAADIERCLPSKIEETEAYDVYAILSALKDLDPARAARQASKVVDDPAMRHVQSLLRPMLGE